MFIKLILFVFIILSLSIFAKEPIKLWDKEFGFINDVALAPNNEIVILDTTNISTLYWVDRETGNINHLFSNGTEYLDITFSNDSSLISIYSMRTGYIILKNDSKEVIFSSNKGGKPVFIDNDEYYLIDKGVYICKLSDNSKNVVWANNITHLKGTGKPRNNYSLSTSTIDINNQIAYLILNESSAYMFLLKIDLKRNSYSSYQVLMSNDGLLSLNKQKGFIYTFDEYQFDKWEDTKLFIKYFNSSEDFIAFDSVSMYENKKVYKEEQYPYYKINLNVSDKNNFLIVGGDGIYNIESKERFEFNIPNSQNFNLIEDEEVIYFSIANKLFKYDLKNVLSVETLKSEILDRIGNDFIFKENVKDVKIIDLLGNYIEFNQNQKIDISNLNIGMYILQYTYDNEIHNYKFIK